MSFPSISSKRILTYSLFAVLCFWWLPFSIFKPEPSHPKADKQKNQVIKELLGHVGDSHQLHFGHVCIPLPVIAYKQGSGWHLFSSAQLYQDHHNPTAYRGFKIVKGSLTAEDGATVYDFSITKNVLAMLLSVLLMVLLFVGLASHMGHRQGKSPQGLWVLPIFILRFVRKDIARKNIGEEHYERFTPYLLTLFFYILFNNLLGLLPEGANITGNITIAATLACFTLFITVWNGSRSYWKHMFMPPGVPVVLYPMMAFIEVISLLLRSAVLAIRLFANMLAGHLSLLSTIGIIFITKSILAASIVVPLGAAMILLKIFVSFIQAYVFTLLSAIAFGSAVKTH